MTVCDRDLKDPQIQDYLRSTLTVQKPVNRYSRAGYYGKFLKCPHCDNIYRVYHFAWSALGCLNCKSMVDKEQWSIVQ